MKTIGTILGIIKKSQKSELQQRHLDHIRSDFSEKEL